MDKWPNTNTGAILLTVTAKYLWLFTNKNCKLPEQYRALDCLLSRTASKNEFTWFYKENVQNITTASKSQIYICSDTEDISTLYARFQSTMDVNKLLSKG